MAACALVGIARSTYYRLTRRYAHYRRVPTPIPHRERTQPAALTADERRRILDVVTDDDYADAVAEYAAHLEHRDTDPDPVGFVAPPPRRFGFGRQSATKTDE